MGRLEQPLIVVARILSTSDVLVKTLGLNGEFKQVTAERREEKEDTAGRIHYFWKQVWRDNHLLDCELMIFGRRGSSRG